MPLPWSSFCKLYVFMVPLLNCGDVIVLNLIFRLLLLQVESNGFLSDNHFSDVEAEENITLLNKSQVLDKKQVLDDFSDEQVIV